MRWSPYGNGCCSFHVSWPLQVPPTAAVWKGTSRVTVMVQTVIPPLPARRPGSPNWNQQPSSPEFPIGSIYTPVPLTETAVNLIWTCIAFQRAKCSWFMFWDGARPIQPCVISSQKNEVFEVFLSILVYILIPLNIRPVNVCRPSLHRECCHLSSSVWATIFCVEDEGNWT